MQNKLINFNGEVGALKIKVFRYISYDVFKTIVQEQLTRISRISRWEEHDPFENVLFKFPLVQGKEKVHLDQLPRHYFAQCWTLTRESDLMWQLYRQRYAKQGGVVKLESSIEGLLNSVSSLNFSYVGKVRYLTKEKLIDHSRNNRKNFESILMNDAGRGNAIAKMLLVKRYPYHQEKEVRLIVRIEEESRYGNYYDHKTTNESFISRVVFDPKLKDDEFRRKKIEILNIKDNLHLIRSELYKLKYDDFH